MESLHIRHNYSRNILLRMTILAIIVAFLVFWKIDFINTVYFRDQLTSTGLVINGVILALFLMGIFRIIIILFIYRREEKAVLQFTSNHTHELAPLNKVPAKSMVARRYMTMEALYKSSTPINQGALAATLVASESTRNSLPKFINNILILSGVFGTIVSLSIALIGASDLLSSAVNMDGMGLVIHGMSTALSTTITAILCYIYFGYFYMKLTDVQTQQLSAIEQVTTLYMMPRFQVRTESVLYEFTGLIRALQDLLKKLDSNQGTFGSLAQEMQNSQAAFEELETRIISALVDVYKSKVQPISSDMNEIKELLKIGFRLPEDYEHK
ncbi:MAG: hypothetical protein GY696_37355 [Gammaproteobacteria bacterium]|nr:hypothetical protein [Gammaproteobacteria bacterium]